VYVAYNPNPNFLDTGDCVIRAISKLMGYDWDRAFIELSIQAYLLKRPLEDNVTWGEYLRNNGYKKEILPDCPGCFSVRDFCAQYNVGSYAVATGSHVVAVIDGDYYDSWDSGDEILVYLWRKL